MSRNYNAYDRDDLYDDDDDYYSEEDDGHYDHNGEVDYDEPVVSHPQINIEESIQFLLETLNSGGVTVKVSENKVRQMLELYDYNVEKTLDYFLNQRQPVKKSTTVASSTTKTQPTAQASSKKSAPISLQQPQKVAVATTNKSSISTPSSTITPKPVTTSKNDIDLIGLSQECLEISSDDEMVGQEDSGEISTNKPLIVVVAGHVDAGKSTLVGNILMKSQGPTHRQSSAPLSWLTDESVSEREHGVTIDVAEKQFSIGSKQFVLLDAPGHRDFIPNMIAGASEADIAILVIPGNDGEYETAIGDKAQTREHAVILKAMGINQIIVAVNKLDCNNWDKERYQRIEDHVRSMLIELKFKPKAIKFVPLSGQQGENISSISASCPLKSWYTGSSLFDTLSSIKIAKNLSSLPVRVSINSVNKVKTIYDLQVKILQGRLRINRTVNITSNSFLWTVQKIYDKFENVRDRLDAGEVGRIEITRSKNSNTNGDDLYLIPGMIMFKGNPVVKSVTVFKATIVTMDDILPIIPGSSLQLFLLGEELECQVTKLYRMLSKEKGVIKYPKCIQSKKTGSVRIEVFRPINIQLFNNCESLGRFALRSKGKTLAVGVCTQLPK